MGWIILRLLLSCALGAPLARAEKFSVDVVLIDRANYTDTEDIIDQLTAGYVRKLAADQDIVDLGLLVTSAEGYEILSIYMICLKGFSKDLTADLQSRLVKILLQGQPWRGQTYRITTDRVGFVTDLDQTLAQVESISQGSQRPDPSDFDQVCEVWLSRLN